jgi:hypothetical protein
MYLFAIAACIFLAFWAFWFVAYFGFRAFQKFCPRLFRKVESRLEPQIKNSLNPDEREFLGVCPPGEIEKRTWRIVKEELDDGPPVPPSQLAEGEHWINLGLKFEQPALFIRWDTRKKELARLLASWGMTTTEHGEFIIKAVLPGTLHCTVVFQLDWVSGELKSVNILLPGSNTDIAESFRVNQVSLGKLFGEPSQVQESSMSQWDFLRVEVKHELVYPPYANEPKERHEFLSIRRKSKSEILKSQAIGISSDSNVKV